jgi:hypothetical protein
LAFSSAASILARIASFSSFNLFKVLSSVIARIWAFNSRFSNLHWPQPNDCRHYQQLEVDSFRYE